MSLDLPEAIFNHPLLGANTDNQRFKLVRLVRLVRACGDGVRLRMRRQTLFSRDCLNLGPKRGGALLKAWADDSVIFVSDLDAEVLEIRLAAFLCEGLEPVRSVRQDLSTPRVQKHRTKAGGNGHETDETAPETPDETVGNAFHPRHETVDETDASRASESDQIDFNQSIDSDPSSINIEESDRSESIQIRSARAALSPLAQQLRSDEEQWDEEEIALALARTAQREAKKPIYKPLPYLRRVLASIRKERKEKEDLRRLAGQPPKPPPSPVPRASPARAPSPGSPPPKAVTRMLKPGGEHG